MIRLSKSTVIPLLCLPVLMVIASHKNLRIEHKATSEREVYGDFHRALNVLPGRENEPPNTEWLNMGYWEVRGAQFTIVHCT